MTITFKVLGQPVPKGSMKAFMRPGMKFPIVTGANKHTRMWSDSVRLVAQKRAPAGGPWKEAVVILLHFHLVRPVSLPKKIVHHIKKPDVDKLVRNVADSLKGVIYKDDSQVVTIHADKSYASGEYPPGVLVTVNKMED